jgi:branched-chain amino acid transport system substrate-binding protein
VDPGKNTDSADRNLESIGTLSRREFLKIAGVAGGTIGVGAGLGGLLTACGGTTTTTTTAGGATTTTAGGATSSTTAPASTTTVSAVELGREIKLGYVVPRTGRLADFGITEDYTQSRWKEFVGDGQVLGDGKKHPITFSVMDSQSDTNRASQVAGDLITNTKVDFIMAAGSPDVVIPVADQAEGLGCPCLSTACPADPYYYGRGGTPAKGFKWTYHFFWGNPELIKMSLELWKAIPTNKKVALMLGNDIDGNSRRKAMIPVIKDNGYTAVDGGAYNLGAEDFTQMIGLFKKEGCEIIHAVATVPDWSNFWKQCYQQGFLPKITDLSKPVLFSSGMEALGNIAYGLSGGGSWHPSQPFKSSLTGETSGEFALAYEQKTGKQWQQTLRHSVVFEWAMDVLKRTKNVDDKEEIIANVASTKMADSIFGAIDFTAPVKAGTAHPVPNVVSTECYEGQWVKGHEQNPWSIKVWPFDLKVIINNTAPSTPIGGKFLSFADAAK